MNRTCMSCMVFLFSIHNLDMHTIVAWSSSAQQVGCHFMISTWLRLPPISTPLLHSFICNINQASVHSIFTQWLICLAGLCTEFQSPFSCCTFKSQGRHTVLFVNTPLVRNVKMTSGSFRVVSYTCNSVLPLFVLPGRLLRSSLRSRERSSVLRQQN